MPSEVVWLEGESGPFVALSMDVASAWNGERGRHAADAIAAGDACADDVPVALLPLGKSFALVLSDNPTGDLMPTAWWRSGDDLCLVRLITGAEDQRVLEATQRRCLGLLHDTQLQLSLGERVVLLEAWETLADLSDGLVQRRSARVRAGTYRIHCGVVEEEGVEAIVILLRRG